MELSEKQLKSNFTSFIWHATFLALTASFMDIDTIIPSMVLKTGGSAFHVGCLTAIMVGGARIFQLPFAGFLSGKERKKNYLLAGINLRIFSLFGLSLLLIYANKSGHVLILSGIFFFISIFSLSGAFANVTYVDILGKSIAVDRRKTFFTRKQIIISVSILTSAFAAREILRRYDTPLNYGVLFSLAAVLLGVASLGFWRLYEKKSEIKNHINLAGVLKKIPGEIVANGNLKYYLIINNIMGICVSIMPFMVLYAKEHFELSDQIIGNFLLFKIAGMLLASLAIGRFSNGRKYRGILYVLAFTSVTLPLSAMLLVGNQVFYQFVFFASGVFTSAYRIAMSGILVEISNENNRSLYTGIAGAGDIATAVFPMVIGAVLPAIGFNVVFTICAFMPLSVYAFIPRMDCVTGDPGRLDSV